MLNIEKDFILIKKKEGYCDIVSDMFENDNYMIAMFLLSVADQLMGLDEDGNKKTIH